MADLAEDFVAYPKNYESMREPNESPLDLSDNTKQLDASINEKAISEKILPILETKTKLKSIAKKIKQKIAIKIGDSKPVKSTFDDRISKMIGLALILANNKSYNKNNEIRDNEGNFIPGSNVINFLKFATQKLRRFEGMEHYVRQLLKGDDNVTDLITNPVVIRVIELENKVKPKETEVEEGIDQTEIVSELEVPSSSSKPRLEPIKRKIEDNDIDEDSDVWTNKAPKKPKLDDNFEESDRNWEKINVEQMSPNSEDQLSKIISDLNIPENVDQ